VKFEELKFSGRTKHETNEKLDRETIPIKNSQIYHLKQKSLAGRNMKHLHLHGDPTKPSRYHHAHFEQQDAVLPQQ
jgi:hypothetical protein